MTGKKDGGRERKEAVTGLITSHHGNRSVCSMLERGIDSLKEDWENCVCVCVPLKSIQEVKLKPVTSKDQSHCVTNVQAPFDANYSDLKMVAFFETVRLLTSLFPVIILC